MELKLYEEKRTLADVVKHWVLRIAIAVLFFAVGQSKFNDHGTWVQIFNKIGFGNWFRYLAGVMQAGGAILVLIPKTCGIGILLIACTMLGAMLSWIFLLGMPMNAFFPAILLFAVVAIGAEDLLNLFSRTPPANRVR